MSVPDILQLVEPSQFCERSFLEACKEFAASGEEQYKRWYAPAESDFTAHIKRMLDQAKGIGLPIGWVPASTLWMVDDDASFFGSIRIRHHLNTFLEQEGGHIGYDIRPSKRGLGLGNEILRLGLIKAKELGISKVLITCDQSNIPSRKVIEKNRGVLQDMIDVGGSGDPVCRYWVAL